jgi:hypothetical protein
MGCLPNLVRPLFGNYFALFWHPVMTIVFLGMLVVYARSAQRELPRPQIASGS